MSEVDHSLHMREFSPWSEIPTRYAADTADVGHDVDDAWKELGVYDKLIILPVQYAEAYNLSEEKHWLATPESHWNFLCLHCINLLRQALYYNNPFYRSHHSYTFWHRPSSSSSPNPESQIRNHLAHCVDSLRQLVMCWSDSDVLPLLAAEFPLHVDFARRKKCRNFESLRRWVGDMQWEGAHDPAPVH
ncbi:uncharacterized protein SEPMUDRAFT_137516 [Sphaerulina musiva SO2202]|uniref:Uncharacterized protein n=1 Tax=Sphaerulina musiva (strain SO2202) TaxID=692275 RepID=N1QHQ6_SPHMS|nr:uncharacterized protein SEPMUDRAFT_137516 [Sphaerulina musiva SO2202]EMF16771.1 hypothetical protein SEPMUDRAFT_137516 [Sphaerulina musiva SO2202]